jgi:M6 family metalloprotease-like protein
MRASLAVAAVSFAALAIVPAAAAAQSPDACKLTGTGSERFDIDNHPTEGRFIRSTGTVKAIMLFVDFPDARAPSPTWAIRDYVDLLATPATSYFAQASSGRFDLDIDAAPRWLRMSKNNTEYAGNRRAYVEEAIALWDPLIDFSQYEVVYLIPQESQTAFPNSPTTSTAPASGVPVDGTTIHNWVTVGRDVFAGGRGHTITVHETGHMMGLPDLYEYDSQDFNRFVGGWDMMGWIEVAPDFMQYHKWRFGWVDDRAIVCIDQPGSRTVRLSPTHRRGGGDKAVVVKLDDHRAYVFENRQIAGLDTNQCDSGVIAYRVDANIAGGRGPIEVIPAQRPPAEWRCTSSPRMYRPLAWAPYDIGAGEFSVFEDAEAGVRMTLTRKTGNASYQLRVDYG